MMTSPSFIILLISLDRAGRDTFKYSASWDWVCMISTTNESFSYVRIDRQWTFPVRFCVKEVSGGIQYRCYNYLRYKEIMKNLWVLTNYFEGWIFGCHKYHTVLKSSESSRQSIVRIKRWGVAKVRGAIMYSIITSLPNPSIISVRSFPSKSTNNLLQGVPCVTTISFY